MRINKLVESCTRTKKSIYVSLAMLDGSSGNPSVEFLNAIIRITFAESHAVTIHTHQQHRVFPRGNEILESMKRKHGIAVA